MVKKARAWEGFKGKIPQWEGEGDWMERVRRRKEEFLLGSENTEKLETNVDIGRFMVGLSARKEEISDEEKEINLNLEALQQILSERFENEGMQSMRLTSGHLLYLQDEPYAKVDDKDKTNQWFVEQDMDVMRQVPWTSLNALVKERMKNLQPLPDGVSVYMKTSVKVRKG